MIGKWIASGVCKSSWKDSLEVEMEESLAGLLLVGQIQAHRIILESDASQVISILLEPFVLDLWQLRHLYVDVGIGL